MANSFNKTEVRLPTDVDMLLIAEKGARGGISYSINRYTNANNKYMKHYDKNKESSYLKCWDVNNSYGCAMSRKLSVNCFEWVEDISKFDESFIKSYNEESNEGYFLEFDVQYTEKLHDLQYDLSLLPERIKIEKVEELVVNLLDKEEYVINIRNLKQALDHGLVSKKVHKVIKFNQKA